MINCGEIPLFFHSWQMHQFPLGVWHLQEEYYHLEESNIQASSSLAPHGGTKILAAQEDDVNGQYITSHLNFFLNVSFWGVTIAKL